MTIATIASLMMNAAFSRHATACCLPFADAIDPTSLDIVYDELCAAQKTIASIDTPVWSAIIFAGTHS